MIESKRTVVVTGGSRGIGRAICMSFAAPDTNIYFNYFSPNNPKAEKAEADKTIALIKEAGGFAHGFSVNISNIEEVETFFKKIEEETRKVDILVNNAGISKDSLLVRLKESDWDDVIDINLKGSFICTKIAAKIMMKQKSGRIINIASVVGVIGNAGQASYSASKGGIIGFTKSVAKELAGRNITVNAVAPGFIKTDMTASLPEKVKEQMLIQIPLGQIGEPQDVANAVEFLASKKASYITGQVIHVNGGMYM